MTSLDPLARILVDAFDVDIQLWMGRALQRASETPGGANFHAWADSNPLAFASFLRGLSAASQQIPHDRSLLLNLVRDHLARLPAEVARSIQGPIPPPAGDLLEDPEFVRKYELALENLGEEERDMVAALPPGRLKEWVLSPAAIRPAKLKHWRSTSPQATMAKGAQTLDELAGQFADNVLAPLSEIIGNSALAKAGGAGSGDALDQWRKKLEALRDESKGKP